MGSVIILAGSWCAMKRVERANVALLSNLRAGEYVIVAQQKFMLQVRTHTTVPEGPI